MPPAARHSQAACLAQTALHGPPVETQGERGFSAIVALECGPPVSPPVALMELSRQCRVWKGTLPSPVGVFNTITCLLGSHLACRVYSMLLPPTSWGKGGNRGEEKEGDIWKQTKCIISPAFSLYHYTLSLRLYLKFVLNFLTLLVPYIREQSWTNNWQIP